MCLASASAKSVAGCPRRSRRQRPASCASQTARGWRLAGGGCHCVGGREDASGRAPVRRQSVAKSVARLSPAGPSPARRQVRRQPTSVRFLRRTKSPVAGVRRRRSLRRRSGRRQRTGRGAKPVPRRQRASVRRPILAGLSPVRRLPASIRRPILTEGRWRLSGGGGCHGEGRGGEGGREGGGEGEGARWRPFLRRDLWCDRRRLHLFE